MNKSCPVFLLSLMMLVTACASADKKEPGIKEIICQDPRPQMCTMHYMPVCALLQEKQYKTYSNACSACSDPDVISYIKASCE